MVSKSRTVVGVPEQRIRRLNAAVAAPDQEYVLYWMTAFRRTTYNFSLQRALEWAAALDKPLLVFEALRSHYRWANDRIHQFVLQGMLENQAAFAETGAYYYPYVEPESKASQGLLDELMKKACVVVTDDFPCFFIPTMLRHVARTAPVCMEAIDSNGLFPMRSTSHEFPTAYAFRRFLQKELTPHLSVLPVARPLDKVRLPLFPGLPGKVLKRWPIASPHLLNGDGKALADLAIDHSVPPASFKGGMLPAQTQLRTFLDERLSKYGTERNEVSRESTSGLSPYLHFGHISVHQVFAELTRQESWTVERVADSKSAGQREGWWKMSPEAEGFLDELVTWRELGYNLCSLRRDYDRYESLPEWARKTLEKHASDPRPQLYSLEELESANTHDELWNAAQTQLVREGRMHNYMRMLWGKKVLQWSASPRDALHALVHLNNKYAIDGRNPNSYSGIFWCLGRYDRAWGPERPIFGTIRYMSSDNTARKFDVKPYLRKYSASK